METRAQQFFRTMNEKRIAMRNGNEKRVQALTGHQVQRWLDRLEMCNKCTEPFCTKCWEKPVTN